MKNLKTYELFYIKPKSSLSSFPKSLNDLEMKTYEYKIGKDYIGKFEMDYLGKKDDEIYLHSLEIYEEYRGKGYGKSLLINILDRLKKYKVRWIGLTVANDNKNALHLYNSLGFKNPKDIDEYNGHALTDINPNFLFIY